MKKALNKIPQGIRPGFLSLNVLLIHSHINISHTKIHYSSPEFTPSPLPPNPDLSNSTSKRIYFVFDFVSRRPNLPFHISSHWRQIFHLLNPIHLPPITYNFSTKMLKFTLLFIAFLGASFIFQGVHSQEDIGALTCQVNYYTVPLLPKCEIVTDDLGQQLERCSQSGSAVYTATLGSRKSQLVGRTFELNDIELMGYCDCVLRIYTEANLEGCYIKSYEISGDYRHTYVSDLWTRPRNSQSFTLHCNF